jgi:DNA-binding CsgD family transcriptional regulator
MKSRLRPVTSKCYDCSSRGAVIKEIAGQRSISPRTVKQHLRTLFLRAGVKDGRKQVKLATAMFIKEQGANMQPSAIG